MHELFPPFRFRCAENGVYIGSYPTLRNMRFLLRLQLKTIVSLIPEPPIVDLEDFCRYHKIQIKHFACEKYKEDSFNMSAKSVCDALDILIDNRNHPIYVHCLDGANISSTVIMCLRKLQNWQSEAIMAEASRYCHEISKEQTKFLKNWKGAINAPVPEVVADWVRWHIYQFKQSSIKITFPPGISIDHISPVSSKKKMHARNTSYSLNSYSKSIEDGISMNERPPNEHMDESSLSFLKKNSLRHSSSMRRRRKLFDSDEIIQANDYDLLLLSPTKNAAIYKSYRSYLDQKKGYAMIKKKIVYPSFIDDPPAKKTSNLPSSLSPLPPSSSSSSTPIKKDRHRDIESLALETRFINVDTLNYKNDENLDLPKEVLDILEQRDDLFDPSAK